MAFSSILRRSASQVLPLAIGAVGSRRYYCHCLVLFSAVNHSDLSRKLFQSSFPSALNYSTKRPSFDEFLIRVIKSEIKCAEESEGHDQSFKLDCCLSNTDAHVTGGSEDGFIYFWDLVDASVLSSFQAHSSVVTSVSYHPKDSCIITASVDGSIRVWKN